MFNQFFQRPKTIRHKLNAPLLEERLRYLTYRAEQETAHEVLHQISFYQLVIIKYLRLKRDNHIYTFKELETAEKRWAYCQKRRLKRDPSPSGKRLFTKHAMGWLQFLRRLEMPKQPPLPPQIAEFLDYLRKKQTVSEVMIISHRYHLKKFFSQIKGDPRRFLKSLTPAQLDAIQIKKLNQKLYALRTIQKCCTTLRAFFSYAERQGWCRGGIANSIQHPRIYKHATLPLSPSWEDVKRLLKTTEGNSPSNIRDRAIILLLATYGLRNSEICHLQLEDFDWEHETFRFKRSKLGPMQQFPLVQTVGRALVRYLKEVRPQRTSYREIFLTLYAPFRPLDSLYGIISSRWKPLNVAIKYHGPHSLRHACATRLINQGAPLKTIADQLGHRHLETTRIYAKVDLTRLREVANFNLRGVL